MNPLPVRDVSTDNDDSGPDQPGMHGWRRLAGLPRL